jgi:hypothetical protein
MKRARALFGLALLAATVLWASTGCCSRMTNSPACATPPAPGPSGTVWPDGWTFHATALTEDGAPKQLVPGTTLTMLVEYAYHVQVMAGCDHMFFDGSNQNGHFFLTKVDSIPPPQGPCSDSLIAQDTWIRQFFADSPEWSRNAGDLTLRTDYAEIDLVAYPAAPFIT